MRTCHRAPYRHHVLETGDSGKETQPRGPASQEEMSVDELTQITGRHRRRFRRNIPALGTTGR